MVNSDVPEEERWNAVSPQWFKHMSVCERVQNFYTPIEAIAPEGSNLRPLRSMHAQQKKSAIEDELSDIPEKLLEGEIAMVNVENANRAGVRRAEMMDETLDVDPTEGTVREDAFFGWVHVQDLAELDVEGDMIRGPVFAVPLEEVRLTGSDGIWGLIDGIWQDGQYDQYYTATGLEYHNCIRTGRWPEPGYGPDSLAGIRVGTYG